MSWTQKKPVHLGHTVIATDSDCIIMATKNNLWKSFNMFIANFGQLYRCIKIRLLASFVAAFMGHHCGI